MSGVYRVDGSSHVVFPENGSVFPENANHTPSLSCVPLFFR